MKPALSVEALSFSYQEGHEVLKDLNFKVNHNEILGILGPNGGGKSTLLKLLAGLLSPNIGSIQYLASSEEGAVPLIYIPQKEKNNNTYPLTIGELLAGARLPKAIVKKAECKEALKQMGLDLSLLRPVSSLSGGEYQRVLLAKAILFDAKVILMDEPTKGLDGVGQDKLLELIQYLKTSRGAAIILVDHNISQVLKHCDRLLCLNKTYHWHDHKNQVNKTILEDTYHCEFEHLLIHEKKGDILSHDHHQCEIDDHNYNHNHKAEKKEEGDS
jgi:zinc transport system ATP-binding protein